MRFVLARREKALIMAKDICRLATISSSRWPHVVPVSYVYLHGKFYIPTFQGAKKVKNLLRSRRATIVVDDERLEHGIMIECASNLLGRKKAGTMLEHMRKVKHWTSDGTTTVIELKPVREASWFLKSQ